MKILDGAFREARDGFGYLPRLPGGQRIAQRIALAALAALMMVAIAACAGQRPASVPASQVIEVQVESDDPLWPGPLECQAKNNLGNWPFVAPGEVTVSITESPLEVKCKTPPGFVDKASVMIPSHVEHEYTKKGAIAGASVGTAVGIGLAIAVTPVAGPGFLLAIPLGSAAFGAQAGRVVGGVADVVKAGEPCGHARCYLSPIVLRIERIPPGAGNN